MDFYKFFELSFNIFIPELFFLLSTLLVFCYGLIMTTSKRLLFPIFLKEMVWSCIGITFFTIILILKNPHSPTPLFNNALVYDEFGAIAKVIILIFSAITLLISVDYCESRRITLFEFPVLVNFSTFGMLLLVSSSDLLSIYMAIELQALGSYILLALKKDSSHSSEASLKYFILGSLSTCIFLYGCSLVYGNLGTTNLSVLQQFLYKGVDSHIFIDFNLPYSSSLMLGIIFIIVGFLFKLGIAPFHAWVPDIYEGGPTNVIAYFAIVAKYAVIIVFLRVFIVTFSGYPDIWQPLLITCSLLSVLVGSITGLMQKNIKRLLGYSSVNHMGLILMGIATGTVAGISGSLIYIFIYMVMSLNIWTLILASESFDTRNTQVHYLTQFSNYYYTHLPVNCIVVIVMSSMAGIPPFIGFFSKFFTVLPAVENYFYTVVVLNLLISSFSTFFYIRVIKIILADRHANFQSMKGISKIHAIILTITTLILISFAIYPEIVIVFAHKIALLLFQTKII
jgi:NADH-quinone oxidoreductase subunit N